MANMCLEVDWKFDKWGRSGVGFGWGRGWGLRDSVNDWMKVQLGKVSTLRYHLPKFLLKDGTFRSLLYTELVPSFTLYLSYFNVNLLLSITVIS